MIYPISDEIHFLIGGTIAIILVIYMTKLLVNKYFNGIFNNEKMLKFTKTITNIIIIFVLLLSFYKIIGYLRICNNYNTQNFKYIPVSENLIESIKEVDDYILRQEQEVYILDARAGVYMIPINRYNKNYDMFLIGNLGGEGSNGIIEDLQSKENAKLLLLSNEHNLNWQTPLDIIKYVKQNYNKIEKIGSFDVYEK